MLDNSIIIQDCEKIVKELELSPLKDRHILITGASGLIGTYITCCIFEYMKVSNNVVKVTLVCNSGIPEHLKKLSEKFHCKFIVGDLTDEEFLASLEDYDDIIHAACYGQPGKFMADKISTIMLNTYTTKKLLEKVNDNGRFLFISSSEVYSGSDELPYKESCIGVTMPDHPRACYIEGKRLGEALCYAFSEKNINVKIARVALAYGPGVKGSDRRVLYNFIQKAILDHKIEMLDQGESRRVYSYVADTVHLLLSIMLYGKEILYNVGGNSEISIKELAELIGKELEVEVIVPETSNNGLNAAPQTVKMDISKVTNEFDKKQFIDIKEGIKRTIEWYRQII